MKQKERPYSDLESETVDLMLFVVQILLWLLVNIHLLHFCMVAGRRVARIWKRGGGYFERVRSVQTTLTRIFIDPESVLDGLSEN